MVLQRLPEGRFAPIRSLFEDLRYNLVVDSVVDGNTPAWVYADDPARPRTALMWNRQDALLLAGNSEDDSLNAALHDAIAGPIVADAGQRGIPALSLHVSLPQWQPRIGTVLAGLRPELAWRRAYALDHLWVDWRRQLPAGRELLPIDPALLARDDLQHVDQVRGWVYSFWRSVASFAATGLGYCLLQEGAAASCCLSVYVSGSNCELGLATHPDFRGRGYATLVAAACVEHCLVHGWTPHWHCWDDNQPSIAVAHKVGFANPRRYQVYRFAVPQG
jgi:RimJ/RimL family protein N-acetyltransferase